MSIALRDKLAKSATVMLNSLLIGLAFLSPGFVPLKELPNWVQPLAPVDLIPHLVETM